MASSEFKGISRIDNEGKQTHGWFVRVFFNNRQHSKLFSDASHGGREKALKKAVKYRNELEKELGKPRSDRRIVLSNKRNQTGVLGVQRVFKNPSVKSDPDPFAGAAYEVTWSPEANMLRKISFSIAKYGEEEAFRRAVDYRQRIEKKVYGRVLQTEIPPFEELKARLDAKLADKLKKEGSLCISRGWLENGLSW
jgi:hypothetical protein